MLHKNYAHFIGKRIDDVLSEIEESFFGHVVVLSPGYKIDASVRPTRLKVFVDEQNVITRIVNG